MEGEGGMSESSDAGGLNVWLSPVVRGSFRGGGLTDRQQRPQLLYCSPFTPPSPIPPWPPLSSLLPVSPPSWVLLFISLWSSSLTSINADSREKGRREVEGWLVFQCFRCCLCHVRKRSDALFICALIYVFIRQCHFPSVLPFFPSIPSEAQIGSRQ